MKVLLSFVIITFSWILLAGQSPQKSLQHLMSHRNNRESYCRIVFQHKKPSIYQQASLALKGSSRAHRIYRNQLKIMEMMTRINGPLVSEPINFNERKNIFNQHRVWAVEVVGRFSQEEVESIFYFIDKDPYASALEKNAIRDARNNYFDIRDQYYKKQSITGQSSTERSLREQERVKRNDQFHKDTQIAQTVASFLPTGAIAGAAACSIQ